jgi:hypothetical protein
MTRQTPAMPRFARALTQNAGVAGLIFRRATRVIRQSISYYRNYFVKFGSHWPEVGKTSQQLTLCHHKFYPTKKGLRRIIITILPFIAPVAVNAQSMPYRIIDWFQVPYLDKKYQCDKSSPIYLNICRFKSNDINFKYYIYNEKELIYVFDSDEFVTYWSFANGSSNFVFSSIKKTISVRRTDDGKISWTITN